MKKYNIKKYKNLMVSLFLLAFIVSVPTITFAKNDNDNNRFKNKVKVEQSTEVNLKNSLRFRNNYNAFVKRSSNLFDWFQRKMVSANEKVEINRAPVISSISSPTVLEVGETGEWTIKAHDPENGNLTYEVQWGDEKDTQILKTKTLSTDVQTGTFTHTYYEEGKYKIKFIVTDEAGVKNVSTVTVKVIEEDDEDDDEAPVIKSITGDKSLLVGETTTITIKAYDPENKPLTYSVDWGDISILSSNALQKVNPIFVQTSTMSHTYTEAGTYTATFTVKNDDGKETSSSIKIKVKNYEDTTAPVISKIEKKINDSGVQISWETNEKANSSIFYGTEGSIDINSTNTAKVEDKSLKTDHSLSISGLTSNTLYHFIIKSVDASNNVALSSETTFVTN